MPDIPLYDLAKMKFQYYLTPTRYPYIIATFISLFVFFLIGKSASFLLFILLFLIVLVRDFHYRKLALNTDKEKMIKNIQDGMKINVSNWGIEKLIETSKQFFEVTSQELLIQAGNLDPEFYENDIICNGLRRVLEKGCKVRIICSPLNECNPKTKTLFKFQENPNFDIKILHARERPDTHFMVSDNKHYRLERKHLPGVHYEADIVYNNCTFANFNRKRFAEKWREITGNVILE